MKVLLITSDREQCGIREYGRMLMESLPAEVEMVEFPQPDPAKLDYNSLEGVDIIHLNHHAALHSQWTRKHVQELQGLGKKVVVTQHDTFETWAIMQERGIPDFRGADALVVHEPVEGLTWIRGATTAKNVHLIRQGIPELDFPVSPSPMLRVGTVGFDFPWKNFNGLARAATMAGWVPVFISPGISEERQEELRKLAPEAVFVPQWLDRMLVLKTLNALCRATAFLYVTGNSGTSAGIRLGIGARRPVLATKNRQVRDLWPESGIDWADESTAAHQLANFAASPNLIAARTSMVEELANRLSWKKQAQRYAEIYESLL